VAILSAVDLVSTCCNFGGSRVKESGAGFDGKGVSLVPWLRSVAEAGWLADFPLSSDWRELSGILCLGEGVLSMISLFGIGLGSAFSSGAGFAS
jgi:hypothetical protein